MMIKFPFKLLIWKPFKVNLEFIEIDPSCINLESIQKQSILDGKIKKFQHCWGKPMQWRDFCVWLYGWYLYVMWVFSLGMCTWFCSINISLLSSVWILKGRTRLLINTLSSECSWIQQNCLKSTTVRIANVIGTIQVWGEVLTIHWQRLSCFNR